MKVPRLRRGAVVFGVAAAMATGLLVVAQSASAADVPPGQGSAPGHLQLQPKTGNASSDTGDLTSNPAATWSTDVPCPAEFPDRASVAIVTTDGGGNFHTASDTITLSGSTPPSGSLNDTMGTFVRTDGLVAGQIYEVVVRCLNAATFAAAAVQSTYIQIAADGNSWTVVSPGSNNPVSTTTALTAPDHAQQHADVALTATVTAASGSPAGSVDFLDGASSLGTATVGADGKATATVNSLAVGSHQITAKFTPNDPNAFDSSTSDPVTVTITSGGEGPSGSETITVDIPSTGPGALALTVANQNVTMTRAALDGANLKSTGSLNTVSVNDTRSGAPGWSIQGRVEDFKSGGNAIPGNDLGWTPSVAGQNPAQDVTAGAKVDPGGTTGLEDGPTLASAGNGKGAGQSSFGAALLLLAPDTTPPGTYTTTLTVTAMIGS